MASDEDEGKGVGEFRPDWERQHGEQSNVRPIRPDVEAVEVSEDTIASAFTREYGGTMRFDHNVGKWFEWLQTHWRRLDTPAALHYARLITRQKSSGKRTLCKTSVMRGAEILARAHPTHACLSEIWDRDPMLLGTAKGTINLTTGKLAPADPALNITKLAGCEPSSKPPAQWLKFLGEATGGNEEVVDYLQRVAGYCLTGLITEHALFFVHGPGGNGKSVFVNLLQHILGDYSKVSAMETFTASKYSRHSTDEAMLKGARGVFASETEEGRAWAEAKIKQMTGGDPITARFMRQDNFTFTPQFKLMIIGNFAPSLQNVDAAMRRRFHVIPFSATPLRPDPMLEQRLKEMEGPQILGWAIRGCLEWQRTGLARPGAVANATEEYFREQDILGQWIEERCELGLGKWEEKALAFADWCKFAKAQGEEPWSQKSFGSKLVKRGIAVNRLQSDGTRKKVYRGLALKRETIMNRGQVDEW